MRSRDCWEHLACIVHVIVRQGSQGIRSLVWHVECRLCDCECPWDVRWNDAFVPGPAPLPREGDSGRLSMNPCGPPEVGLLGRCTDRDAEELYRCLIECLSPFECSYEAGVLARAVVLTIET